MPPLATAWVPARVNGRPLSDGFIRVVGPVIDMRRNAVRNTEINGQMIAEGETEIMDFGGANRDETVFADPDAWMSRAPTTIGASPSATARTPASASWGDFHG